MSGIGAQGCESSNPLPLAGSTVVVTRAAGSAAALSSRLRALGATPIAVPTIATAPPTDNGKALRQALQRAEVVDQLVVASPNGARALIDAWPGGEAPPVACVGPATAEMFDRTVFTVNVVAERSIAEGLVDALGPAPKPGARALVVQAEVARAALVDGLRTVGWVVERVVGYRTVDGQPDRVALDAASRADIITFTSSSTVERYLRLAGASAVPPVVVTIGPATSATARQLGVTVDVEADPHTIDGLIDALISWAGSGPGAAS